MRLAGAEVRHGLGQSAHGHSDDELHLRLLQAVYTSSARLPFLKALGKMMRQQMLRSFRRSQRLAQLNVAPSFSTSARRPAEVELTVDGKKVSIEGTLCLCP